ncbi:MAG: response regulator transcription factor [Bacteroidota bacterium]
MPKILYVEDEPFLGKIVKESLETRDFEVQLVTDGQLVIGAYEKFQPDICVLDVMLPNRDGFSIGKEIREKNSSLPIIYLTAKNQTADVVKGFDSGGNDYVRKPFSVEELIVRINNLLQLAEGKRATASQTSKIKLGRYYFYPKKQLLTIDKNSRQLSHREAQLLSLLTATPNAAVKRKFILDEIWGNDSFFNSRNLDVYIRKLRNYLSADESVQIITLKGVGYRLVC